MIMLRNTLAVLALGMAALLLTGAPADAKTKAKAHGLKPAATAKFDPAAVLPQDRSLGDPKAKVTIIEYGSVACPACAEFNATVMPDLKSKYIATGKVRYIFRPMLTGVATVAVAGTRLAECAGKDKYFDVVDAVMRGQDEYYAYGESNMFARPVLLRIAKSYGLDEAAFNTCVLEPNALKTLNANHQAYITAGVHATPTFFINGKRLESHGLKDFDDAIAAASAH